MLDKINEEPALFTAAIAALIALLTAFGLDLNGVQIAAVMGVAAIVSSLFIRAKVVPVVKLDPPVA